MLENLVSTAERRALLNKETHTTVRLSDFMGIIPAITGKVELVYEGEQEGATFVAEQLLGSAIKTLFPSLFPRIEKLSKKTESTPYDELLAELIAEGGLFLYDDCEDSEYTESLNKITALSDLIAQYQPEFPVTDQLFLKEFVLWALAEHQKLGKERMNNGFDFGDLF